MVNAFPPIENDRCPMSARLSDSIHLVSCADTGTVTEGIDVIEPRNNVRRIVAVRKEDPIFCVFIVTPFGQAIVSRFDVKISTLFFRPQAD
jgi:hypothetical protein